MDKDLLKALILRAQRVVVPKMPFAEDPGAIAGIPKHFGQRDFFRAHQRTAHDRVPDAGAGGVAAG